mgnify:FL=1
MALPSEPAPSAPASSSAVRRLRRDLEVLQKSGNPQILVRPAEDNLLEWHFVLHALPEDTPYNKGCYHGKVIFPAQYPHAPPAILMMTPSGRLETGKRLCLSMTDFHPESWNPAWSVETILVGLLSFFISDEKGYGSVRSSEEQRKLLAEKSWETNAESAVFQSLFPDFLGAPETVAADLPAVSHVSSDSPERLEEGLAMEAVETRSERSGSELECWICRDVTDEPLIQPCRCRGSMSGVHASCVEEWIRSHRRTARDDAPPRCSVCHQPYQGSERVPRFHEFVSHNCRAMGAQCGRTLLLVVGMMLFQECAMDGDLPIPWRVLGVSLFALLALYRFMILMVSLPPHREAPAHRCLQPFFIADTRELAKHMAEAAAANTVLIVWSLAGLISWPFILPFAVALLTLGLKFLWRQPSWACSRECFSRYARAIACIILSPLILVFAITEYIWRYPRALHPLGPAPHLVLSIAVIPMAITISSSLPLLILWGTHALFLVVGLVEIFLVKRWCWKRGLVWVIVLQVSVMGCYVCNICEFPAGVGDKQTSQIIIAGSSCTWLLLIVVLTLKINWELCVQHYRTWQRRHGSFTLDPGAGDERATTA